jgi:hypothetical protein
MRCVLQVVEFANGAPCPIAGQYLKSFDFNAHRGRGYGYFTRDIREAMTFADVGEALEFWRTVSTDYPVRKDGKPNRPLTSTTCQIVNLEKDNA